MKDSLVISTVIAVSTLLSCDCSPAMKRFRTLTSKISNSQNNNDGEVLWVYLSNLAHFYFIDLRWSTTSICQGDIKLEKKKE